MKFKTILIILGILVMLLLAFKTCTTYVGKKIKGSMQELTEDRQTEFLEGIDFSEGEYALILDDKKPPVLVDDRQVLLDHKDIIELETNWMNYLPGEGRAAYGLRLFSENTLIDAKLARKFKVFKIGTLREHGRPLERKYIYEPKAAYERMKDSLQKDTTVFISRITDTDPNGHEYRFTLKCPPLLVKENDSTFDSHRFGADFAQRIKHSLSQYTGFETGINASNSAEPTPLLTVKHEGDNYFLRNSEDNTTLPLTGYILHGNSMVFFCTKAFYEQVKTHDFSTTFEREGLSEEEIKTLIREKIGPDTGEISTNAVYETMFQADFKIGQRFENKYELRYFELAKKESDKNLAADNTSVILTENRDVNGGQQQ